MQQQLNRSEVDICGWVKKTSDSFPTKTKCHKYNLQVLNYFPRIQLILLPIPWAWTFENIDIITYHLSIIWIVDSFCSKSRFSKSSFFHARRPSQESGHDSIFSSILTFPSICGYGSYTYVHTIFVAHFLHCSLLWEYTSAVKIPHVPIRNNCSYF